MNPFKDRLKKYKSENVASRPKGITALIAATLVTAVVSLTGGIFLILYQNENILDNRYVLHGVMIV